MENDFPETSVALERPDILLLDDRALTPHSHPALHAVAAWVRNYLCAPHPQLGRNGPVCPFVPAALQKRLLHVALYEDEEYDLAAIKRILLDEMERFIALQPVSGNEAQFKSLMVLFPDLAAEDATDLIDAAQRQLQERFVPNGLMVGEFHARPPQKAGLWNADFLPLYSPVPMLVIRHMVPTDLLFLKDDARLFREYAKIYGNAVPERFQECYRQAAQRFEMPMTSDQAPPQCAPRVRDTLDRAGITYRVHCHDDYSRTIRVPADFAEALGYALGRITKTLFVKAQGSGRFHLLVCGMDRRVNLRRLSAGEPMGRLEMASLVELEKHIGFPPTSVTPIGVRDIPVLLDEALLQHPTILTGAGVPRVEIEVAPDDLVALCNAQVIAFS